MERPGFGSSSSHTKRLKLKQIEKLVFKAYLKVEKCEEQAAISLLCPWTIEVKQIRKERCLVVPYLDKTGSRWQIDSKTVKGYFVVSWPKYLGK